VELYFHSPNTPSWRGAQLKKKAQRQLYLSLLLLYFTLSQYEILKIYFGQWKRLCVTFVVLPSVRRHAP